MNALVGAMVAPDVWFVNSFSGNGKTTFISSAIAKWVASQVKVYVMPLETTAVAFRTYIACQAVGIDPGIVNSGGLRGQRDQSEWTERIQAELDRQQIDHAFRDHLKVKGVDAINLNRLRLAAEEAGIGVLASSW